MRAGSRCTSSSASKLRRIARRGRKRGTARTPRVSVSRSIFPLVDDRDRAYFGRDARDQDQIGFIDANTRAIFGRSYVG